MSIDRDAPYPEDGHFEPAAQAFAEYFGHIPANEIAQVSIAISLKRLADHLVGTEKRTGVVNAIYDVGRP